MYTFPFGQPVKKVVQLDQTPKEIFVLGVHSSAVYARWIGNNNKERIKAVAVASEPEIFWAGNGAADILAEIELPPNMGHLHAANNRYNGPSGRALDDLYLRPLGVTRKSAWLCDLLPESRCNDGQAGALQRAYAPSQDFLPAYSWPRIPSRLTDKDRVEEIAEELIRSQARLLVTLGDNPLQFFAKCFGAKRELREYGKTITEYGKPVEITVRNHECKLLPLVHPRQADGLGFHDPEWRHLHTKWVKNRLKVSYMHSSR